MSDKDDKAEFLAGRFEEVFAFRQSLTDETDRGCALMAAAYLDGQIEKLLRKRLVANDTVQNEMLGHSGPLGTFSSRIDFAYLLGLIGPKARRDLHLIRKIRNEFGHVPEPIDFAHPPLAARCAELYHDSFGRDATPRTKFTRVVMGVLAMIDGQLYVTEPFAEAPDALIDDERKEKFNKSLQSFLCAVVDGEQLVVGPERRKCVLLQNLRGED